MKFLKLIIFIFLVFGAIWLGGLVWFKSQMELEASDNIEHSDVAIVLTGGSERLYEGLRILNKNYASRLFVSGAGAGVTIKDLFLNAGVDINYIDELSNRIDIGYEAQTTHGNAKEVAQLVKKSGYRSIRLITSNYHMARSYLEFRQLMPDVQIIRHPVIPENVILKNWWRYEGTRNLIIDEYNKFIGASLHIQLKNTSRSSDE